MIGNYSRSGVEQDPWLLRTQRRSLPSGCQPCRAYYWGRSRKRYIREDRLGWGLESVWRATEGPQGTWGFESIRSGGSKLCGGHRQFRYFSLVPVQDGCYPSQYQDLAVTGMILLTDWWWLYFQTNFFSRITCGTRSSFTFLRLSSVVSPSGRLEMALSRSSCDSLPFSISSSWPQAVSFRCNPFSWRIVTSLKRVKRRFVNLERCHPWTWWTKWLISCSQKLTTGWRSSELKQ